MPRVVAGYKEEAKRTILETATGVFAKKGLHETTMDDVAEKLGVSKGAVYQYFPTKDALFQQLCGDVSKKLEDMLQSHFAGSTLREAAESYIDAELQKMERGEMLMFEAIAEAPRNPALKRVVCGNYAGSSKVIADFLDGLKRQGKVRKDLDTASAARLLIALRHGVLVSRVQGLGRDEARRVWLNGFDLVVGRPGH